MMHRKLLTDLDVGGSDVANGTETVAVKEADGTFKLYGYKWFSSATDADIALTLARIVDKNGQTEEVFCQNNLFLIFSTYKLDGYKWGKGNYWTIDVSPKNTKRRWKS